MLLEMAVGGIVGYLVGKSSRGRMADNPVEGRGYVIIGRPLPGARASLTYAPTLAMAEGRARSMRRSKKYKNVEVRKRA